MATTILSSAKLKKVLAALEANWQAEMEGYHTYQTLADRDTDPVRAQVLRHLAGHTEALLGPKYGVLQLELRGAAGRDPLNEEPAQILGRCGP